MKREHVIVLAGLSLLLVPIIVDFITSNHEVVFRYSAPDSFYFHVVARNIALNHVVSFDGLYPTNGFHPFWQILLGIAYLGVNLAGIDELFYLYLSLLTGLGCQAIALLLLQKSIHDAGRQLTLWFICLPIGLYSLLVLPFWLVAVDIHHLVQWSQGPFPVFGTLWSFINGMESSLLIACYALLAYAFVNDHHKSNALIFLSGTAVTLARLDHGLVILPIVLYSLWSAKRQFRYQSILIFLLLFVIPMIVYLCINKSYADTFLPISGVLKSTFPTPTDSNFNNLIQLPQRLFADALSVSRFYRASQLLLPAGIAIIFMAFWLRAWSNRVPDRWSRFLFLTAIGSLLLICYDFFFVKAFDMGHWYVPIPILFTTLTVVSQPIDLPAKNWNEHWVIPLILIVSFIGFNCMHRRENYHRLYAQMYLVEGPQVRRHFKSMPPKMVEFDDGIIAFSTGFNSMSGTGLTLDKKALEAKLSGSFNQLALKRGFDHVSSLVYSLPATINDEMPHQLGQHGAEVAIKKFKQRYKSNRYSTAYISESGNFWVLRINDSD